MDDSSAYIVIPARLASTRLPRKLLLNETGRPVVQHTFEAASKARGIAGLVVAADHEEIAAAVRAFGGSVMMTSPTCASGTDRVAEVARAMPEVDIFVNVQGDEPEIEPAAIELAVRMLRESPTAVMSTLATPIRERCRLDDPSCVKVVFNERREAMYFSRAPIPFARTWNDSYLQAEPPLFHQHLGLYAYRREFLLQLSALPVHPLEDVEKLEQLRVLAAGHAIVVGVVPQATLGIDTPDDYRAFVERWSNR